MSMDKKASLESEFLQSCVRRHMPIEKIETDAFPDGWYMDVNSHGRRFNFGTDARDGYSFCERVGLEYLPYALDLSEPYFAQDNRLIDLSISLIEAALADPEFRGFKPRII